MTDLTTYQPPTSDPAMPSAAHALVEWAQSADAAYALANRLCSTAFVPAQFKGKPVEAAAAMLAGAEVGLSPMASLRAFDVIQGVAAPRALTVRAIAQSQGHEFITDEATPTRVKMRGRRRGASEWQSVEWTIQRATQLGLTGKDQWKKQPQTMLIARATTELVRLIAADAILGIGYSYEEIADEAEPTTTVARDTAAKRTVQRKRAAAPEPAEPEFPDDTGSESPAEPEADVLSDAQLKKVNILLRENGYTDREAALIYVGQIIGREIASTKTLTKAEAHAVIEFFEADPDDQPTDTLPGMGGER